ncbi:MAG: hypothetical protein FJX30_00965 [Alphaproteobacteria bacterium]|nr:hypothetical protein [Alphaproteobacteria bacterium]
MVGAQALAEALQTNSNLITLDLRGDSISRDNLIIIDNYLARNQKLPTQISEKIYQSWQEQQILEQQS